MITAQAIAARLAGLDQIGIGPEGVVRQAWTEEAAACREWFAAQAAALHLDERRDPAGNLWACPRVDPPWWGVGSHLDSVRGGGRFDGPLGVVCGFEIAANSTAPVAVLSFADEEGARFNTPTFGSKALVGKLELPSVLERRDAQGVALAEAMRSQGVNPSALEEAPTWLQRLAGLIEIHIDQTTDVARAEVPAAIVSSLASRRRLQVELRGRADHAGTTPLGERRDALSAAAHLIVASEELALKCDRLTVTTSRIVAEPNAPTTIAALVRLWIDARAPEPGVIDDWERSLREAARSIEHRTGVGIELALASRSDGIEFPPELRLRLARAAAEMVGRPAPEFVCFAGHDAGVLAQRIPAAMLLVRNQTGVSHSPQETVALEDAATAAGVVQRMLEKMLGEAG